MASTDSSTHSQRHAVASLGFLSGLLIRPSQLQSGTSPAPLIPDMTCTRAFVRAALWLGICFVTASAAAAEAYVVRTNYSDRTITNFVDVTMPRNVFVNRYNTNYVDQFRTNLVNTWSTNYHVRTLTNNQF